MFLPRLSLGLNCIRVKRTWSFYKVILSSFSLVVSLRICAPFWYIVLTLRTPSFFQPRRRHSFHAFHVQTEAEECAVPLTPKYFLFPLVFHFCTKENVNGRVGMWAKFISRARLRRLLSRPRSERKKKTVLLRTFFSATFAYTRDIRATTIQTHTRCHTQQRSARWIPRVTTTARSCVRQSDWQTDEVTPSGPESGEEEGGGRGGGLPLLRTISPPLPASSPTGR